MNTESIVYLMRKTNLNLKEIGKLTPAQFNEILKELYYQESVGEWRNQHSVATLLAAIYNTIPRKRGARAFKADDFLKSEIPARDIKKTTIGELAEEKGIKLPKGE